MQLDNLKIGVEEHKLLYITITDEAGSFICRKVLFDASRLEAISCEAGLDYYVRQYNDRMEGRPCDRCVLFVDGCEETCDVLSYYKSIMSSEENRQLDAKRDAIDSITSEDINPPEDSAIFI